MCDTSFLASTSECRKGADGSSTGAGKEKTVDEELVESREETFLQASPDYDLVASPWIGLHYKCEAVTGRANGARP